MDGPASNAPPDPAPIPTTARSDLRLLARSTRSLARSPVYWITRQPWWVRWLLLLGVAVALMYLVGVIPPAGFASLRRGRLDEPAIAVLFQALTFCFALVGFAQAMRVATRLDQDHAAVREVERCAGDKLREFHQSDRIAIDLDQVPDLWPQPLEHSLSTLRLCQVIHGDAVDGQYAAREALVQGYRDDYAQAIGQVAATRRIVVHAGILGTFVGLFRAMPNLGRIASGGITPGVVDDLLVAMALAFSTSILALTGSICLGFVTAALVRRLNAFARGLEQAALDTMALCRKALNRNHMARTLHAMGLRLETIAGQLGEQNDRITHQTSTIDDGVERLERAAAGWAKCLAGADGVHARSERAIADVTATIATVAQAATRATTDALARAEQAHAQLSRGAADSVRTASAAVTKELSRLGGETIATLQQTAQKVAGSQAGFVDAQRQTLDSAAGVLRTTEQRLAETLQPIAEAIARSLRAEREQLEAERERVRQAQASFISTVTARTEALARVVEEMVGAVHRQAESVQRITAQHPVTAEALVAAVRASNEQMLTHVRADGAGRSWYGRLRTMIGGSKEPAHVSRTRPPSSTAARAPQQRGRP